MTWLPRLQSLWRNLAHRDGVEHEIDDEITALEALLVEEKRAAGLTSAEAHRAARLELGGPRQLKERVGEAKAGALLDTLWRDIRYAVRRLRQDSGFTLAAGVALSLGLGVNTMLFTIFNAHTIRELPIPGASEVVDLSSRNERDERRGLSYREFEDVRSSSQSFEAIAAVAMRPVALGDDTLAPDRARGAYVSAKLFEVLRDLPSLGRGFLVDDERPGAPGVVVLAASLWRERYGADPRVLGRTVTINGVPATVVGIASDQFRFTFPMIADIFVPLAASPGVREESRDQRGYSVFGRLRADATLVRVRSELEGLGSRLTAEHPDTNRGVRLTAVPISERFLGDPTSPVWLAFMTAGILVALIGCANVANLLTMRCAQRSQEIAIRASLGASRRRIVGQLLVESLVLALLGAALGWGLALGGLSLFASLIPAGTLPPWMHYAPDLRVFAVVAAGCIGSVFVFGLAPSLYVSKTDFNNVLKDGGRMGAHLKRSRRWTGLFLTLQFALTVVFVSQLAIARQQVEERRRSEVVVDTTNVVTMWMNLAGERYIASDARLRMIDQLGDELEGTAALSSLSFASALPMEGAALRELDIPGQQMVPGSDLPVVSVVSAGDRYFETLGLPL
ncbi:MAG: ABC transporter permease, partial [Vicinamibacterales bacterium]